MTAGAGSHSASARAGRRSGARSRVCRVLAAVGAALLIGVLAPPGSRAQAPIPSTLAVAQPMPVTGLDPAGAPAFAVYPSVSEAAFLVYDGLVALDQHLRLVPQLATSWSVAADGRTWTVRLRPGVQFQDGTPLTAEAVAEDLRRQADPAANPSNRLLWDAIASVSAAGEDAVRIVTRGPHAQLLHLLADGSALLPSPSAVRRLGTQYRRHPVGTGPYAVGGWDPGRELEMVRNAHAWGGAPAFDRIVLRTVTDAETRAAMIKSGTAQVAEDIPVDHLADLRSTPGVAVMTRRSLRTFGMAINLTRPALQDHRVREALNYAVDKELLVKALFAGTGAQLRGPLAPATPGYVDLGPWPYDPPRARRLLEDAGWRPAPPIGVRVKGSARLEITLLTPHGVFPRDMEVVETLADYLRNVGFEPHFLYLGPEAFLDQVLMPPNQYRWDLALFGFNPSTGDGGYQLSALYASNPDREHAPRAWNIAWYGDPAVDAWLREAAGTGDESRRTADYANVERRVWADAPYLWLYTEDTTVATRGVRDVIVLPTVVTILRAARP